MKSISKNLIIITTLLLCSCGMSQRIVTRQKEMGNQFKKDNQALERVKGDPYRTYMVMERIKQDRILRQQVRRDSKKAQLNQQASVRKEKHCVGKVH